MSTDSPSRDGRFHVPTTPAPPSRRRHLSVVAATALALTAATAVSAAPSRAAGSAIPTIAPVPLPLALWGIGETPLVPLDRALVPNPHSGTVGDPTNPALELRVAQDGPDGAPVDPASLVVSARIVPNGERVSPFGDVPALDAVTVTTGITPDRRRVSLRPVRVGNAKVVVTVTGQDDATASYTIDYYASRVVTPTSRFLQLTGDASTAIDAGDGYLFVAGDEHRQIRLYDAKRSGLPIALFHPGRNPNDNPTAGNEGEDDFEASARSGDAVFWIGSHGNSRKGEVQASRQVVYETTIAGHGKDATLTRVGAYGGLRRDLIAWDDAHGRRYGLAAAAADGQGPNDSDSLNIEGAEFAPDGTTLYLGFRAPLVGGGPGGDALIVPVTNIQRLTRGEATTATFGTPIELDFDGASIREMRRNAAGEYLILTNDASNHAPDVIVQPPLLWYWDGDPVTAPQRLGDGQPLPPNVTELSGSLGSWEAIGVLPDALEPGRQVPLLMDQGYDHLYAAPGPNPGGTRYYADQNKDSLAGETLMKSRLDLVTLTGELGYRLTVTGLEPFGAQAPGTASPPRTATIANAGRKAIPVDGLAVQGDDAGDFRIDPGTCAGTTLEPGDRCAVTVRYAPTRGATSSTAQLAVASSAPLQHRAFALSGTSATGAFVDAPAPLIDVDAPVVGDRLTATVAAWSPAARLGYQWLRGGAAIPGGTGATYTATDADRGYPLSVRVTGTADGYEPRAVTSARTAAVRGATAPPDVPPGVLAPPIPDVLGPAPVLDWNPVRSRYAIKVAPRSGRRLLLTVRAPALPSAMLGQRITVKVAGVPGRYRVALERGRATLRLGAKAKRLRTGARAAVTVTVPAMRRLVDKQPSGRQAHDVRKTTKRFRIAIR